jgi:hypothetical protein
MNVNQTPVDPIPEEFDSYEAIAEFWDAHDTTDYPDAFETVQVEEVDIRNRRFEVEVEADLIGVLSEQAKQRGIAVSQLVNSLLRENLSNVA